MNAIELLMSQHRFVDELFHRYERSTGDDKLRVLGKIVESLLIHTLLENRYLYPVARRHDLEDTIDLSTEEHRELVGLIAEISRLEPDDPRLDSLVARLQSHVERHVVPEEIAVFPLIEARVGRQALDTIGKGMETALPDLHRLDLHHLLLENGAPGISAPLYL